ncbi:Pyruvate decarboxylase 1 [Pichia californica]|uniref:Pyruvate decarboxylase 1 n=1 Tax=Pichia californica TaxID=460514 RepID=A0A9P7BG48_9ASCO|nr:Pyruvate decarboxylase 1 [[Candida] californica]KAG0687888.1 Pyruvate decarboxylase 1 [[Candida] californica]
MTDQITLGRYLFEKIKEAGVNSVFGVPGDFNLALLDHIKEVENLRWVGNANELNAGYEADGYSRINGFSCIITTFGVGELSAINAIAGSYAEHIPLIHIVGMPSILAEEKKLLLHHTLGDSKFDDFIQMSEKVSGKLKVLTNLESAPKIINDLIETSILTKRPVYLGFPSNFSDSLIPSSTINNLKLNLKFSQNIKTDEDEFVENIINLIQISKNPIILVDACASRHAVTDQVNQLAKITKFPVFTTPMGKSSFNEDSDEYYGIYVGELSSPDVKELVESTDCILSIGGLLSDFNTGSFSYSYTTNNVVEFHSNYCKFKRATYENLKMNGALINLVSKLLNLNLNFENKFKPPPSKFDYQSAKICPTGPLTQDYMWKKLSYFLKENDIIVTETGTSSFGILSTHFPKNVKAISQVLWGSIGFSLPAAVGAGFAADDLKKFDPNHPERRVILFIGDGSLQLTVQAISDACRWNIKPYIFVLNNNGYTIEKLIHGPTESYNNIQPWNHQIILDLFANKASYESLTVKTCKELDDLYNCEKFNNPDKIRLIELMLDEFDAPETLKLQAKLSDKINSA